VGKCFFEFLSHDERVDCLCLGDLAKHASGTVLVRQGLRPGGLLVLLEGRVEVRNGETLLSHLEPGEVFGEISFLLGVEASADVVASTEVSVLAISEVTIRRLFKQRPGVAAALYRSLALELARRLLTTSKRLYT
jgi:extracellular factor (EF) 3-hydroxypalmitic acid methyl ester biosynthesis protein